MKSKKESKIVDFCNSPLGAFVIVSSIMVLGKLFGQYVLGVDVKLEEDRNERASYNTIDTRYSYQNHEYNLRNFEN